MGENILFFLFCELVIEHGTKCKLRSSKHLKGNLIFIYDAGVTDDQSAVDKIKLVINTAAAKS